MNVNRVWLAASIWKCLAGAYFLLSILSLLFDDVDFFLFDGASFGSAASSLPSSGKSSECMMTLCKIISVSGSSCACSHMSVCNASSVVDVVSTITLRSLRVLQSVLNLSINFLFPVTMRFLSGDMPTFRTEIFAIGSLGREMCVLKMDGAEAINSSSKSFFTKSSK